MEGLLSMARYRSRTYYSKKGSTRYGGNWSFVWERDQRKCADCGTKKNTIIHHIIPYEKDNELTVRPENLIVVCKKCHCRIHDIGHKHRSIKLPNRDRLIEINFFVLLKEYVQMLGVIRNGRT
jgi:5-methylcytosine-specific restriction endonuclease McrA